MTTRLIAAALVVRFSCVAAVGQPPKPADPPFDEKVRDLFRAGKYDEILKELQSKPDPKRPPPRVVLANLFFQSGQGPNARLNLEAAAADDPKHPEVYLVNASFALADSRVTDVVLSCQTAVQLAADPRWDPDQRRRFVREGRLGLVAAYERRRDWPAVREQCVALLADDPKNGPTRQRLAAAVFHLGRPDEAVKEFETARRDDPAVDLPELRMFTLYATGGDPAKAGEWLKKAVSAHPADATASRTYAGWLLDGGDVAGAQRQLDAAAKADPTGRDTLVIRGLIARYRKDYAAAEEVFDPLHRDRPNDAVVAWNLALALADGGKIEKQRRAVELALAEASRNPKAAEAYAVLGWCYYKVGRVDEAEKALNQVVQSGMISRDAAYFLARLLADKQQWVTARQVLQAAANSPGGFVYRADAQALLAEVEKHVPKADEPKPGESKKP